MRGWTILAGLMVMGLVFAAPAMAKDKKNRASTTQPTTQKADKHKHNGEKHKHHGEKHNDESTDK